MDVVAQINGLSNFKRIFRKDAYIRDAFKIMKDNWRNVISAVGTRQGQAYILTRYL